MSATPELLVIGHVTRDEIDGGVRLGGGASYAARAAAWLGVPTGVLTAAPAGDPLLADLRAPGLEVRVIGSPSMTTFALDYGGPRRRLFLRARARPLSAADVPPAWRAAPIVYLGPVAGECDGGLAQACGGAFVGAGIQGWLRHAASDGRVEAALAPEAATPPDALRVATLSEEDHPDAEAIAARLAIGGITVALTRGARGATVLVGHARTDIPAEPAREVDPTGAGDVFAVTFTVALARGLGATPSRGPDVVLATARAAARLAARVAARVVEGPGLGRLPESAAELRL